MPEVLDRLRTLLGNTDDNNMFGVEPNFDEEIYDRMWEFITSLDPEQLTDDQADNVISIIEDIELEYGNEEEDEDDVGEAVRAKRVRISPAARRQRRQQYRKSKAKMKRNVKQYRRSARGRQMAKKSKRMKKMGKTATGKRIRKFAN